MKVNPKSLDTIFDIAITAYGTINGVEQVIKSVNDLDSDTFFGQELELDEKSYPEFVSEEADPDAVGNKSYFVREKQTIYDIATQEFGDIQDLSLIIGQVSDLDTGFVFAKNVSIKTTTFDPNKAIIERKKYIFATGETDTVPLVSNWILATGFWDDNGLWIDTDNWID